MNSKDFAIGILSVTAVVLLVGLFVVTVAGPREAYATGQNDRSGDYVVSTCQLDETAEIVYILDAGVQVMNAYAFDINQSRLEMISSESVAPRAPRR